MNKKLRIAKIASHVCKPVSSKEATLVRLASKMHQLNVPQRTREVNVKQCKVRNVNVAGMRISRFVL
jgi:hypothetical protein